MPDKPLWDTLQTRILNELKFPKKDGIYTIEPVPAPASTTRDGKYGKQTMYIVKSKEIGLMLVNQYQFLKIVEAFKGDYSSAVTVQF